jgi:hypothetical protein
MPVEITSPRALAREKEIVPKKMGLATGKVPVMEPVE